MALYSGAVLSAIALISQFRYAVQYTEALRINTRTCGHVQRSLGSINLAMCAGLVNVPKTLGFVNLDMRVLDVLRALDYPGASMNPLATNI